MLPRPVVDFSLGGGIQPFGFPSPPRAERRDRPPGRALHSVSGLRLHPPLAGNRAAGKREIRVRKTPKRGRGCYTRLPTPLVLCKAQRCCFTAFLLLMEEKSAQIIHKTVFLVNGHSLKFFGTCCLQAYLLQVLFSFATGYCG